MNFSTIAVAALLLGLSGIAAERNAAEQVALCPTEQDLLCPAWCMGNTCKNVITDEPILWCAACDFCQNPTVCDSYCNLYQCDTYHCKDCDFCQTAPGKKCEPMCNQLYTFVDGEWKYQFPPAFSCVATPEECGGCPACQQCETWCSPSTCGTGFCANCEFCKEPFEDTPTCAAWCSDWVCADSQDFCSGCNWCKTRPKRCDMHCDIMSCIDSVCEDCDFCPPQAPLCENYCNKLTCNFGSEGYIRPCTGCPFCTETEIENPDNPENPKPKKSKKSKSGGQSS